MVPVKQTRSIHTKLLANLRAHTRWRRQCAPCALSSAPYAIRTARDVLAAGGHV